MDGTLKTLNDSCLRQVYCTTFLYFEPYSRDPHSHSMMRLPITQLCHGISCKKNHSLRWFMHPLFSCWISMAFPASNVWWQFIGYPSKALAPGFSCSATPMNLGSSTAHGWRHIPKRPRKWNWEGWGSTYRTSDLTDLTKGRLQKISTKKNTWIWYDMISF